MSSRDVSNAPEEIAISKAKSIYHVECKTNRVYAFVFTYLKLVNAENHNRRLPIPNKCGPFSAVSARYLDRGRVWVVGAGDGMHTSEGPRSLQRRYRKSQETLGATLL